MSTKPHINNKSSDNDHGTTTSYIIGFALSLIFTFIPYYLVVNKVFIGTSLLLVILGIAILQMFIQIFFFLHLGRGPKPFYNIIFFAVTAGTIVIVVGATLFIMSNLYHNMSPREVITRLAQDENITQVGGKETGACNEQGESHIVTISSSQVTPKYTTANRCDTLTFLNEDNDKRVMEFGEYTVLQSYGGLFEVSVDGGDSETITLNESGSFKFYDQLELEVSGYFIVEESSEPINSNQLY